MTRRFDRAAHQTDDYIDAHYEPEPVVEPRAPISPDFRALTDRLLVKVGRKVACGCGRAHWPGEKCGGDK